MLKGINPILPPELLDVLRAMGHGDEIVIADANFPAATYAQRLIRMDSASATKAAEAVLSLLPLDAYVETAAFSMQVVGAPAEVPEVVKEFQHCINANETREFSIQPLERFAFYERCKGAFAIVVTGEYRLYGNLILKKGVITPETD